MTTVPATSLTEQAVSDDSEICKPTKVIVVGPWTRGKSRQKMQDVAFF